MIIANLLEPGINGLLSSLTINDSMQILLWKAMVNGSILAQKVDVDLWRDVQTAWYNFVQSGQIWALILGFIIGYFIRGMYTIG